MKLLKKKILLINPPFYRLYADRYSLPRFPLGLAYLAASISQGTDWDVKVFNADFHPEPVVCTNSFLAGEGYQNYIRNLNDLRHPVFERVRALISSYSPDVVGITSMTQNYKSACKVAEIAKEVNPSVFIIMGGAHPTLVKEEVLDNKLVDICVCGEGDNTICEILNSLTLDCDFSEVKGIFYRSSGEVVFTGEREMIKNLNSLPFPVKYAKKVLIDHESFPLHSFQHVFSSRGCPYRCFFCGSRYIWGNKTRFRSVDNVVEELTVLRDIGLSSFIFEDDTFAVNEGYVLELCEMIGEKLPGIEWSCEMHVKCVNDRVVSAMKKAGCRMIQIGFESGNDDILRMIKKNNTVADCLEATSIIKRNNLLVGGFFMVGFPWETEKTLCDTHGIIKKLNCFSSGYSIFTPYKGTEAFETCVDMGLIKRDYDYSLYNHQSPENCFCSIPKDKFRRLCYKIERTIDRQNFINRLSGLLSWGLLKKIKRSGFRGSLQKFISIVRRK